MSINTPLTLDDWSVQGMSEKQGQQFASQIQDIKPLKLFIRSLPGWCAYHKTGIVLKIIGKPEWSGVGVEMGFDRANLPVHAANDLINRLTDTSRLIELEYLVETMKGLGVDPVIINRLVDEADILAQKLSTVQ